MGRILLPWWMLSRAGIQQGLGDWRWLHLCLWYRQGCSTTESFPYPGLRISSVKCRGTIIGWLPFTLPAPTRFPLVSGLCLFCQHVHLLCDSYSHQTLAMWPITSLWNHVQVKSWTADSASGSDTEWERGWKHAILCHFLGHLYCPVLGGLVGGWWDCHLAERRAEWVIHVCLSCPQTEIRWRQTFAQKEGYCPWGGFRKQAHR